MIWKKGLTTIQSNGIVIVFDIIEPPDKFHMSYRIWLNNNLIANLNYPENIIEVK